MAKDASNDDMREEVLADAEERMKKTVEALQGDLRTVRTGRASPALLEKILVEYYGMPTPLIQLAGTSAPEPRLLLIRPFDRNTIGAIEKAILKSDLGLTPTNDGTLIRLGVPALTEERRRDLVKMVARRAEEARISIRNIRRDANDMLHDLEKEKMIDEDELKQGRDESQKLTDSSIKKVDDIAKAKEAEVLEG